MVSVVTPAISVGLLKVSVIILVRGKIRVYVDTIPKSFQPIGSYVVGTGGWVIVRQIPTEIHKHNGYICKRNL